MKEKLLFDLNDICIIPAIISDISSRSECNIYNERGFLPLMTSPMDTVISKNNIDLFLSNGIVPCIPRGQYIYNYNINYSFQSFGLSEIEEQLKYIGDIKLNLIKKPFYRYPNVLIDMANGNMNRLLHVVKEIKTHYPNVILMVGNVANPLTYKNLAAQGVEYIRVGVGGGSACLSSSNLGVHYPMGSLILECAKIKKEYEFKTKIVADGGIKGFDDIIKCLGLGCFIPSTLVYTKTGFKQIQNIKINDEVLTHNNVFKHVVQKYKYNNYKRIISINGNYSTDNHCYYVIHKKYKKFINNKNIKLYAEWIPASDLNSDYYLIQKKFNLLLLIQKYFKNIFSNIYILYLKITNKLYEEKI